MMTCFADWAAMRPNFLVSTEMAIRSPSLARRLTFLAGASVEGADSLFDLPDPPAGSGVAQLPALPDSEASTVTALRQDYNNLLAALRTAGLMASAPADGGGDG